MKKLYLGLLFTALTHGTACLNAAESNSPLSMAVRCDGSKDSKVSYNQKVFYLSKDFVNEKNWDEIEAYIIKVDNKNCHSFYVMKRVGSKGDGYKMLTASSFDDLKRATNVNESDVYFAWDGSEDLTGAGKNGEDLSQFKYPQSSMLWLIPAIGIPVVTGLLLFHQYNRTQEVKAPKRASKV